MNSTVDLMKSHCSIRKYTEKDISSDTLKTILECGQMAPTSHNMQAYSIIVVKNPSTKSELSKLADSQKWVIECPVFLVFCADLYRLSTACSLHGKKAALNGVENLLVSFVDAALVAENVLLAARSLGLGGVMVGGIRNDCKKVSELLNLPEYVIPVAGMCLGYPDQEPGQRPRLSMETVVHMEEYSKDAVLPGLEAYDKTTSEYYINRTNGQRSETWTEIMAEYLSKERRLELKEFIVGKGIEII